MKSRFETTKPGRQIMYAALNKAKEVLFKLEGDLDNVR